jgi:poly-beta-1,6-N-acetyl-D-glucosamine synthase
VEIVFWISAVLVLYTYILYPMIIWTWSSFKKESCSVESSEFFPFVTVVVSVYNEEAWLSSKMENIRQTQYPSEKIQFLFGSDGSRDRSVEILQASEIENLEVRSFEARRGKAAVLNDLIKEAKGEIIVFSDANTLFNPDTVHCLVSRFRDASIGCVCGQLVLQANKFSSGGLGEYSYWSLENLIKHWESRIESTVGATGAVYAIRRSICQSLPLDKVLMDDFVLSTQALLKGSKVIYEPLAIASEQPSNSVYGEFRRKVRIAAANFNGIPEFRALFLPKFGFVAFALWSRKAIRWMVPFLLIIIFISSIILFEVSPLYQIVALGGVLLCLIGAVGFVFEKLEVHPGFFGLPYYFLAVNLALLIGFFKFVFKSQRSTWDVIR